MNESGSERKYTITVSIDSPTLHTLKLSIDELGIDPGDASQVIEWTLDADLSKGGEFVAMTACKPGFEWLSNPPPKSTVFGKPSRIGKDVIQLRDTHRKDANSTGAWLYTLRVEYDGATYETTMAIEPLASGDTRAYVLMGSNPIIINR